MSSNQSAAFATVLKYRSRRRSGGNVEIPKVFPLLAISTAGLALQVGKRMNYCR
jgi:hypothetical protein